MRKPNDVREAQKAGEQVQVLNANPTIPEVRLGPVQVAGGVPGVEDELQGSVERSLLDPSQVAPVVADATLRQPIRRPGVDTDETPREAKYFAVLEDRFITDATSGARTKLRAGKVISDQHYNIRALQQQGVKLKRTEAPGTTDEPIEELLSQ